jgi:hypothetical protein
MTGWTSKAALIALGGLLLWLGATQLIASTSALSALAGLVAILPGILFTGLAFTRREPKPVPVVAVTKAVVLPFKPRPRS